jgi:hypothetical protein
VEEVGIDCIPRSHLPYERLFGVGVENICIAPESFLVKGAAVLDARVDDGNPSMLSQQFAHFSGGELGLVNGEYFAVDHVIEVAPQSVEGQSVRSEAGNDCFQLADVRVPPAALMIPEGPEGRQVCPSVVKVELLNYSLRVRVAEEKPKIDDTSN